MFRYPKMPGPGGAKLGQCVAFEKLDGTNLFWEWHPEFGWTDFGTRSASYRFDPTGTAEFAVKHPGFHQAVIDFANRFYKPLAEILAAQPGVDHAVAFTEFLGPNSFAGMHRATDVKELVLIDVYLPGFGFVGPWRFLKLFAGLPQPKVVYQGKFSGKLTEDVRAGKYPVNEGVVIKGGEGGGDVWMAKVKTAAYLERLQAAFGEKWEEYWE